MSGPKCKEWHSMWMDDGCSDFLRRVLRYKAMSKTQLQRVNQMLPRTLVFEFEGVTQSCPVRQLFCVCCQEQICMAFHLAQFVITGNSGHLSRIRRRSDSDGFVSVELSGFVSFRCDRFRACNALSRSSS